MSKFGLPLSAVWLNLTGILKLVGKGLSLLDTVLIFCPCAIFASLLLFNAILLFHLMTQTNNVAKELSYLIYISIFFKFQRLYRQGHEIPRIHS